LKYLNLTSDFGFLHWFEDLDRFVSEVWSRPYFLTSDHIHPDIDLFEDEKDLVVKAELPGVKKEDIQVSVDGDQVSIGAEVRSERDAKEGERVLHTERYYGKVSRSFRLGQEVDREHVEAKFNNGVLELNLPKKAAQTARQITIQ